MSRVGRRVPPAELPVLPALDLRVNLAWAGCDGSPYPSRVEEHASTVFAVLAPLALPVGTAPGEGGLLTVSWQTPRGIYRLPSELLAVKVSGGERLWWLAATGPVSVLQRRAYVRVPASLAIRLDGPCGPSPAVSIDLSEGGLGCRLTGHGLDPWVFDEVTIPIDDQPVVTSIRTVRYGIDPATGRRLLGANFVDLPRDTAAHLRRHVYARQVGLRRVAGRAG